MSAPVGTGAPPTPPARRAARRTLLLLALVGLAPVVASYVAYHFFPRARLDNYGTLVAAPAAELAGRLADGSPFGLGKVRGKWAMLVAAPSTCDSTCRQALYATRQARTMQGRESDRVVRVWLVTDGGAPAADLLAEHPGLEVVAAPADALQAWPGGAQVLYLLDPLGNVVTRYPREPDIKRLARDLSRLLRASSIG